VVVVPPVLVWGWGVVACGAAAPVVPVEVVLGVVLVDVVAVVSVVDVVPVWSVEVPAARASEPAGAVRSGVDLGTTSPAVLVPPHAASPKPAENTSAVASSAGTRARIATA
jgi:hypothetical protein